MNVLVAKRGIRSWCGEHGFTLLETMIGIVILATVGATMLLGTYAGCAYIQGPYTLVADSISLKGSAQVELVGGNIPFLIARGTTEIVAFDYE